MRLQIKSILPFTFYIFDVKKLWCWEGTQYDWSPAILGSIAIGPHRAVVVVV